MENLYIGIDSGKYSIKCVVIDDYNNILNSYYKVIDRNIIDCIKELCRFIDRDIDLDKYVIKNVGVTGFNRKIVGIIFRSKVVRNEVVVCEYYIKKNNLDVSHVVDLDSGCSKIFYVNDGKIEDYYINKDCNMISGNYINSICNKLDVKIDNIIDDYVFFDKKCMIYIDEDINKYINMGYDKNKIINGLCIRYVDNIKDMIGEYKNILFVGGLSEYYKIIGSFNSQVNINNRRYIFALGIGMMARECNLDYVYDRFIYDKDYFIKMDSCLKCDNNCMITKICLDSNIIDSYGFRCYKWKGI